MPSTDAAVYMSAVAHEVQKRLYILLRYSTLTTMGPLLGFSSIATGGALNSSKGSGSNSRRSRDCEESCA